MGEIPKWTSHAFTICLGLPPCFALHFASKGPPCEKGLAELLEKLLMQSEGRERGLHELSCPAEVAVGRLLALGISVNVVRGLRL